MPFYIVPCSRLNEDYVQYSTSIALLLVARSIWQSFTNEQQEHLLDDGTVRSYSFIKSGLYPLSFLND